MRLENDIDLIATMVQRLYDAETQHVLVLSRVAARAIAPALQRRLLSHHDETIVQVRRLEQVAAWLGVPCRGAKCYAMQGLLKETEESMGFGGDDALVDAAISASSQGIEYFEISQYRALIGLCVRAGYRDVEEILPLSLAEEERAAEDLEGLSAASLSGAETERD